MEIEDKNTEIEDIIDMLWKIERQLDEGAGISRDYGPEVCEVAFYRNKMDSIKEALRKAQELLEEDLWANPEDELPEANDPVLVLFDNGEFDVADRVVVPGEGEIWESPHDEFIALEGIVGWRRIRT